MNKKQNANEIVDRIHYMYLQTDGSIDWPNSFEGDLLKTSYKLAKEVSENLAVDQQGITLNGYQKIAGRTANPHRNALINYALGIAGEAGEVADIIKKYSFHGHEMDKDDLAKELGDVLWYLSNIANEVGIDLERIAMLNIEKLQKRYPNGFDQERSINREVTE